MSKRLELESAAIEKGEGLSWRYLLPEDWAEVDSPALPGQETLRLLEDGEACGAYKMFPEYVEAQGGGSFACRGRLLVFSTRDGSDPRHKGHRYTLDRGPHQAGLGRVDETAFPQMVGIETLNTCNARCVFCPLFQGEHQMDRKIRPAQIMDPALFEACLRDIASWPVRPQTLYLNMDGEPLQDPHFVERMKLIAKYDLGGRLALQTNGQLLTLEKAEAILAACVSSVTFGFDGATKAVYEAHRVRCTYETVLDNIRLFARRRDETGSETQILIKFVRTRRNAHEVAAAHALFNEFLDPSRDGFLDMLAIDWGDGQGAEDLYYLPKVPSDAPRTGCQAVASQMIIHSDGKLAACCFDYNLDVSGGGLGQLDAQGGLLGVWRSAKRKQLASDMASSPLSVLPVKCRSCPALYGFPSEQTHEPVFPELCHSRDKTGFTYLFDAARRNRP